MGKAKTNKTKIIIIVVAIIIVAAALAIVLPLCLRKDSDSKTNIFNLDKRILDYYPENYREEFYSIVDRSNYFRILEKLIVKCYKAPCNPVTNDTKEIRDKEEIKNLTILFDQVFNNSNVKEKTINEKELTDEQKETINTIFNKNGIIIERINYEILNDTNDYDSKYSKRGYYIEANNNSNSMIVIIAMGSKKSEGYSIKIKNIEITNENSLVRIDVVETSPGDEQIVNGNITYPCVKIKFSKNVKNFLIVNRETAETFTEVKDDNIAI